MAPAIRKINVEELSILSLEVNDHAIVAEISDGRVVSIPIAWFERLARASVEERKNFEISPSGYGIHWPGLDEDVSIKAFINP
jgi:hypothetical protein